MKLVVFTDLDGTLLDSNYSYEHSQKAVNRLKEREIPIIFCSSKTRAEQEVYRRELEINDPFIVENGGAIFIPKGYFPFPLEHLKIAQRDLKVEGEFLIIEMGISYHKIRQVIEAIQIETGIKFRGFGDMSVKEVVEVTGLSLEFAERAKMRQYSETIVLMGIEDPEAVLKRVKERGLNWAYGGRHCTIMGEENDKGKAVEILVKMYNNMWENLKTVGIGNSLNDLPMLSKVDMPFLVQKSEGSWEVMELPHLKKIEGIGPFGWSKAIFSFT